jgi:hypothetical protein
MSKISVNHHAGNIMVESEREGEFLCNIYDDTHPIPLCRGKLNFLGGGKSREDISPILTVRREINEEFSLSQNESLDEATLQDSGRTYDLPQIQKMASSSDIEFVKRSILENIVPYQDFLVDFKPIEGGPVLKVPRAIFSVFHSQIPEEIFEIARRNLSSNKSLVNDGFLRIVNAKELVTGNPLTSWGVGRIFENYLGKTLPNLENMTAKPLGIPKESYREYLTEFDYSRF